MTKEFAVDTNASDVSIQSQQESDALIKPWQRTLKAGDCFVYLSKSLGILAWGEVLDNLPSANYRLCRVFSQSHPEGEVGDVHVAVIHGVIAKTTLQKARAAGWPANETEFRALVEQIRREQRERKLLN